MYRLRPYYEGNIHFDESFLKVLYSTPTFNNRAELSFEMLQGIYMRDLTGATATATGGCAESRFTAITKRTEDLSARMAKLDSSLGATTTTIQSHTVSCGRLNEAEMMIECDVRNVPYSVLLLAALAKYRISVHVHSTLIVGDHINATERKQISALQAWLKKTVQCAGVTSGNPPAIRVMVRETPLSDVFLSWNGLPQICGEVNLLRFLAAFGGDSAWGLSGDTNCWLDTAEARFALATPRDRATFLKSFGARLEAASKCASSSLLDAYMFTLLVRTWYDRSSCPRRVAAWFDELAAKHCEFAALVRAFEAAN